jgi:nucleotide-binding universal stress UspA family protein
MFDHVLVGIDEHEGGRDALALARKLLAPAGELTLAHVYAGDPHVYRSASAAYDAAQRDCSVHGSTSLELARSARCPLLVLPRAAGAEGSRFADERLDAVVR